MFLYNYCIFGKNNDCVNVHLASVEAQPGLLAVCEHLPESDSKHPGVCSVGERSGLQTLWGAPAAGRNCFFKLEPYMSEHIVTLDREYFPVI